MLATLTIPCMDSHYVATTARCRLRNARPCDYDDLVAAIEAPAFPATLPLAVMYRQSKLAGWFDTMLTKAAAAEVCWLSIESDWPPSQRCIGQISFVRLDRQGYWNLAFWLHPDYWHQGLAAEAARAAIEFAHMHFDIGDIVAAAADWNTSSMKMLARLGFTRLEDGTPLFGGNAGEGIHIFGQIRRRA